VRAGIVLLEGLKSWDPANVGPFKLLGVLGNGGFGRVYLGQGPDGERVAAKVIKPDLAEDPEFRERFGREVSAARKVGGKFTARVVDADTDGEELWLATEYISGPTLREAVAVQGPLADSSVLALAAGLAEALDAIHAAGLVHRDLKPDNVLLAYDGPRVIDFGIARVAGASTLTGTGVLMGTLAYMSPEQAIGQAVGPPSDVFSLASVLVFAATGRGPYGDGTQAELLYRVAHQGPSLDGVSPQVRALVEPCMAADPQQRPTTRDLVEHLGGTRPSVGWLRTETTAAQAPHDTAPMTAHLPEPGRPSGPTWPPEPGRPSGSGGPSGSSWPSGSGGPSGSSWPPGSRTGPPGSSQPPQSGRPRRSRWSGRRIGVIAVAAVVVVGLAIGLAVSQLGGHHTTASWSGGQRIDTADGLASVSCASADFCAAVDSRGNAFTSAGGSWSPAQALSSNGLSWVSCPTAGFCVATSNGSALYTYAGGKWSSPTELFGVNGKPAHLTSVSCASATFCIATGNMHAYKFSGGSWDKGVLVESTNKLAAVSCASPGFCAVVDSAGNAFTYSGSSWSAPQRLAATAMTGVSCPAAGFCMASGMAAPFAYSGGKWSPSGPLATADGGPVHLTSVSCATPSACVATGGLDGYAYSDGSWARGVFVHHSNKLTAISCTAADFCTAVDSGGNVYTYSAT
jgi:serine/threonine protein kinase